MAFLTARAAISRYLRKPDHRPSDQPPQTVCDTPGMTDIARHDASYILGMQIHSLQHPMWQDVQVLNGLAHATVWLANDPIWSGIVHEVDLTSRMKSLQQLHPDAQLSCSPLEHMHL